MERKLAVDCEGTHVPATCWKFYSEISYLPGISEDKRKVGRW